MMASAIDPDRARGGLLGLAVVTLAAAAILFILRGASDGLYGYDAYFHIRYAQVLRTEGFSRSFPWWQETFLRDHYADKDFLYHVFLIPFTFGNLIAGARAAAALFGASAIAIFYTVCVKLGVRWPALFALALMGSSLDFLYRLDAMRPLTLAIGLAMAGTCAILLRRPRWCFAFAAIYPHAHVSFHLLPCIALLHDAMGGGDEVGAGRRSFRLTAWTTAGAAAGALCSPFFPNNLRLWWVQNIDVLRLAWLRIPELRQGIEFEPRTSTDLLTNGFGVFAALFLAVCLMAWSRQRASRDARTLLVVVSIFLGMTMMSMRFIEFLAPFALLLAAVVVRDAGEGANAKVSRGPVGSPDVSQVRRGKGGFHALAAVATIGVALCVGFNARRGWRAIASDPGTTYLKASEWMRNNVPAGETVFHLDWDDFPQLFYFNPQFNYLVGLDPVFMYATDPSRWRLWSDVAHDDVEDIYTPIAKTFGSRWVFAIPEAEDFLSAARRDPRFFQRYTDAHATVFYLADGFYFVSRWRLTGWYPDPARRLFDASLGGEPRLPLPRPGAAGTSGEGRRRPPSLPEEVVALPEGPAATGVDRSFPGGFVDLDDGLVLPNSVRDACGVAEASVLSDSRQTVTMAITTDDEFRAYVNGHEVAARSPFRTPPPGSFGGAAATLDDYLEARAHVPERSFPVQIQQGTNEIFVKVCQAGADFGFFLRIYRADGTAVVASDRSEQQRGSLK